MQGRRYATRSSRTWKRTGILAALATVFLGTLGAAQAADRIRTAALTPGTMILREAPLPAVLGTADAERYRRIFALQETGSWAAADGEIAALSDRLLLGHVLAQRYLNHRYRSGYAELARWLEYYPDLPEGRAIYALALHRHPAGAPAPDKPSALTFVGAAAGGDILPRPVAAAAESPVPDLGPAELSQAVALRGEIRDLAHGAPRRAELLLAGSDAKRLIDHDERGELRVAIAEGYLAAGDPQAALAVSVPVTGAYAPVAHWTAGLAAWRLNRLGDARRHFQALARSPGQSGWAVAAAAFWAARVELRNRRPDLVGYWLGIAAEHPRTFYGLLAQRLLGIDPYFSFDADPFTTLDAQIVGGVAAGRRALALIETGQRALASDELRALAAHGSPAMLQSLTALADRANLPALSLELAAELANSDGRHHDHALYPVPRWAPMGGFSVDRALLFALMRQESQFVPHRESNAGALGLMQLMPKTAQEMADRTGLPLAAPETQHDKSPLVDPEINLTLAQEYVAMLLRDEHIGGNLLLAACAYNAGIGQTLRWQAAQPELKNDPLLFLESIPSRQARVFTARVLANYWIYRLRLGQPTRDLDALAAGRWPTYTALDSRRVEGVRHADNR